MRAGIVILPEHRWWAAAPKWQAVETYGFDHAWTYDHLGWRSLVDGPWFGAMPTLTAAASVTERIKLGTFVASPHFRHPVSFSREVTALDDISDGRFLLGIGAGTTAGYDVDVLGQAPLTPRAQVERFGEFLDLLDRVLTNDVTSWQGEHYTAVDARSAPRCVQLPRVPFMVAATGPRAMRLVARYGQGWIANGKGGDTLDEWWRGVSELVTRMNDTLGEAGRAPNALTRYISLDSAPTYSLESVSRFEDMVGRAGELGFTDVVAHWPRSDGVYAGHESVLEAVAADVLPAITR